MIKYDVYKHPSGLLHRVPLYSALHWRVEYYNRYLRRWMPSAYTVIGIITSNTSTLVAHNVVFKDKACSQ